MRRDYQIDHKTRFPLIDAANCIRIDIKMNGIAWSPETDLCRNDRSEIELFQSLISKELHYLTCLMVPWKIPLARLFVSDLTESIPNTKSPFS